MQDARNDKAAASRRKLLISDFDGTMTAKDYFIALCERHVPDGGLQHFEDWRLGKTTHFEAMRNIFASAAPGEAALLGLMRETDIDPKLANAVAALRAADWDVVVVSAGCGWYIERILKEAGVDAIVHASPGRIEEGRLIMERPTTSPFYSETTGIDKEAVVRDAVERGWTVAFAGDGLLDLAPASLVPENLRFARAELARALTERGQKFQPFARWSDIARKLVGFEG
jgi:2-hydroxy-3-keto-5-methylthiopentenyl-1-phosphate phosphatase